MKPGIRWSITLIAVTGLVGCAVGVLGFLWNIANNDLPWVEGLSAADYYTAVGAAPEQRVRQRLLLQLLPGAACGRRFQLDRLPAS